MEISASSGFVIQWRGDEVLRLAAETTQKSCKVCARIIQQQAKSFVPKDTGRLKSEIAVGRSQYEYGGWAVIAQGSGNYERFYALFVEIGTGYGRRAKMRPGKLRISDPQPYLRPALESKRRVIERINQKAIAKAFPKSILGRAA